MKELFKRMKWETIAAAVISIVVGLICVMIPQGSYDALCIILGVCFVLLGVIAVAGFAANGGFFGGGTVVVGVAFLICGIFCLVNPTVVQGILNIVFGLFIILDASRSLADSLDLARYRSRGWIVLFVTSLVMIALGCIVLFTKNTVMIFTGVSLMLSGVVDIVMTILFSRRIREAKKQLRSVINEVDWEETNSEQ